MTLETVIEATRIGLLTAFQKENLVLFFATCYLTEFELFHRPLKVEEVDYMLGRNYYPLLSIGAVEVLNNESEVK
jgi:hypothetical protein